MKMLPLNLISPSPLSRAIVLTALAYFAFLQPGQTRGRPTHATADKSNTSTGDSALFTNTIGSYNLANGSQSLYWNTSGSYNVAAGFHALYTNSIGDSNTAVGCETLLNNTTGYGNTATGFLGLQANTTGAVNTASGSQSLYWNTVGNENTANGSSALFNNTTGNQNTAAGANALYHSTNAFQNTAIGTQALYSNTTGNFNTALGFEALYLNTTGSNNIALGYYVGANLTTGSYNIDIGNPGVSDESGTIRIGTAGNHIATFIAGITGSTVAAGVSVVVDANGQLGTVVSSQRFKDEIRPMDKASEAVFSLKPVTFHYKRELDPAGIPQFGLVAEEVEKVDPNLVARDANGKVFTVRYEAVNAMLLNEFLKEHRKVENLETMAAEQEKQIKMLSAALKQQASQIQKVISRSEFSVGAPQTVANEFTAR